MTTNLGEQCIDDTLCKDETLRIGESLFSLSISPASDLLLNESVNEVAAKDSAHADH